MAAVSYSNVSIGGKTVTTANQTALTMSTIGPYSAGTGSSQYGVFFQNGSISTSSVALIAGTSNWTIEAFIYLTGGANQGVYEYLSASGSDVISLYADGVTRKIGGRIKGTNLVDTTLTSANNSITRCVWHHIVLTRINPTTVKLYIDGVEAASKTIPSKAAFNANTIAGGSPKIGKQTSKNAFNGYISNLRHVVGSAIYTSNFTPPTSPLTAVEGTKLLSFQNSTIKDNSTYQFKMSPDSGAVATKMSPFASSGNQWTGIFNGSSSYLTVADNDAFTLGTGNFTIECWMSIRGSGPMCIANQWATSTPYTNSSWYLSVNTLNQLVAGIAYGSTTITITSSQSLKYQSWDHIALVRNGSTISLYLNGGLVGSNTSIGTSAINNSSLPMFIGAWQNTNNPFMGYISNFRIVKGTALYTSNFVVPSGTLTKVANTQLLALQSMKLVEDNSDNRFTLTSYNTPSMVPATASVYNDGYYSAHFNGTTSYSTLPANTLNFLHQCTGSWTFECWFFTNNIANATRVLLSTVGSSSKSGISISLNGSTNNVTVRIFRESSLGFYSFNTGNSVWTTSAWNHLAITFNGSTFTIWINGISRTLTSSGTMAFSSKDAEFAPMIGAAKDNTGTVFNYFTGFISNLRIVNGSAVYTSAFTPPTTPLTSVGSTALLTYQSHGIKDNSSNHYAVTNGPISKPVNPFNSEFKTTSMMFSTYFNGGYLKIPDSYDLTIGTGDFTIECWFNGNVSATGTSEIFGNVTGSTTGSSQLGITLEKGKVMFRRWLNVTVQSSTTLVSNQWYHVAVSRSSGTTRLFLNGILEGSVADSNDYKVLNSPMTIGYMKYSSFYGHISNLRVVKGSALYTSNFNVPTSFLTLVPGTKLLMCQTPFFIENLSIENPATVQGVVLTATTNPIGSSPINPFLS